MSTRRYAFIKANWHSDIVDRALEGFRSESTDAEIEVFDVPGAFEIPLLARSLASTGRFEEAHREFFRTHFVRKGEEAGRAARAIRDVHAAIAA